MKKRKFYICVVIIFVVFFVFCTSSNSYAATPKLINKLSSAFDDIENWLIKLSTPATAVAVGVGLFMKKFSFGDEERIRIGKKLIKGSLFSYAFVLVINLVLSAIQSLLT